MARRFNCRFVVWCLVAASTCSPAWSARLVDVRSIDDEYLMVHWQDGIVEYKDDGEGPGAFMGHETGGGDVLKTFDPAVNLAAASDVASYTLASTDDAHYVTPRHPSAVHRKSKVNGTTNAWPEPPYTLEHTFFLRLPQKMQQGRHYVLKIAPETNTDVTARELAFDVFSNVSEAIHVNIVGYNPDATMKSGDLYMWLGDGGGRDYSSYEGRPVIIQNVESGDKQTVGAVTFWKRSGSDFGNWNLTRADVWNCDFSSFTGTGTFRLAIEGVGCSPDFRIGRDAYYEPFKTSVRGFFYMRLGADRNITPVPRQPRFIPGVDPADFRVYRTTFGPWHPDWKKQRGDVWDKQDWSAYKEPGDPTNPNAWGGHSDATDWDRNPAHISIIWDLLLPYLLSNGKIGEDNLEIAESGNGIPDLIDEARYEVDFWLRLRDGQGGYSSGVNNPNKEHTTMYQAAAKPYMAWANAANAAMLADAFRIAGKTELMNQYKEAAVEAWKIANKQDLDVSYGIGNGITRGRDLKMLAATFLYTVTGDRRYEDALAKESVVTGPTAEIDNKDKYCQFWGTAGYLMCAKYKVQPIHHPDLLASMRAAIIHEAMQKNVAHCDKWPSRRSSDTNYGWFQTTQAVQAMCIAHAVATNPADKDKLLRAMILESDYGLGRNPMNMVQMTGLGSRHVDDIYTSGRNDGTPGVHPGHTPYMNAEPWGEGFLFDPKWYARKGYPTWDQWPHGEALWPAPYCFANNEFTPQQTMRGKMALLGYLYSLGVP